MRFECMRLERGPGLRRADRDLARWDVDEESAPIGVRRRGCGRDAVAVAVGVAPAGRRARDRRAADWVIAAIENGGRDEAVGALLARQQGQAGEVSRAHEI